MNDYMSHRCKELMSHNKDNYKPVCIRKIINSKGVDIQLNYDKWNLYHLECDSEYGDYFMNSAGVITYCPYCGDKL